MAWWTTEVYLNGQTTANDSTIYNGFRWENRFRPLLREHFINPVLYVEYENINEADRSLLEITGHDGVEDYIVPNAIERAETERSLEMKLILSSNFRDGISRRTSSRRRISTSRIRGSLVMPLV